MQDNYGRHIRDLRISVTDRCNFKCFYCKSAHGFKYVERHRLLRYEEIERLAGIFVGLGVRKVRITGGEPLLRKDLEELVARISAIALVEDLALTTNGFNFFKRAAAFKAAGLGRVTISLDSLRRDRFQEITRSSDFDQVLRSIEAAKKWKFEPVKVNCVLVRGINEDEIYSFAEFARSWDVTVRFIEFMPIDEDEQWARYKVMTGAEILDQLKERYEMFPSDSGHPSETARNFKFSDGKGRIGLIMPVSRPFCGECSRIRLTADGKIRTCLFSLAEHDLKSLIRAGADDDEVRDFILGTVARKEAGHRINEADFVPPSRSMSYIGG